MSKLPELSVVVPISQVDSDFEGLHSDYLEELANSEFDYEVIYVIDIDDEHVTKVVSEIVEAQPFAKSISLSRVFGDSTALKAGIAASIGSQVLVLPSYHQIEPTDILRLLDNLDGCDMAIAVRDRSSETYFGKLQAKIYNRILAASFGEKIEDMGCEACAFTRQVANELTFYGTQHRFLPQLAYQQGFRIKSTPVRQSAKSISPRVRTLWNYLGAILDILNVVFLTRFTRRPLRFFGLLGTGLMAVGTAIISYVVFEKLFFGVPLAFRPALVLGSLTLMVGIQIIGIGLIGELVIFFHGKNAPQYHVKEVVGALAVHDESGSAGAPNHRRDSQKKYL